jgi:hypothetical protein
MVFTVKITVLNSIFNFSKNRSKSETQALLKNNPNQLKPTENKNDSTSKIVPNQLLVNDEILFSEGEEEEENDDKDDDNYSTSSPSVTSYSIMYINFK